MLERQTIGNLIYVAFAVFVLLILPAILLTLNSNLLFRLAQLSAIFIILAVSLNLLIGTLGLLSLSHAAFYGLGAYTSALVSLSTNWPFTVTMPLAGLTTGLLAALLAISIVRLDRLFFAVGTLAIGELIGMTLLNWTGLTNGPMGLRSIPPLSIFGSTSQIDAYYVSVTVMLACVWVVHRLTLSHFGTALRAAREDDLSTAGMGINLRGLKIVVFAISAALAGIAGSLLAHTTNFISPDMFRLPESILVVTMVVIGGLGSVAGAVVGAIFLILLPELTRDVGNMRMLVVGIALFLSIVLLPHGIIGELQWVSIGRRKCGAIFGRKQR